MQSDIHPNYRPVVFKDPGADFSFITQSTIETSDTVIWEDGNEYPTATVDLSSASHPFFTGTMKIVDTAGRVERFERRYGRRRNAAPEDTGTEEGGTAAPDVAAEDAGAES